MYLQRTYCMKRPTTSTEQEEVERADVSMAETLMLLSLPTNPEQPRVFECKTCNRQFSSFQALGGHRASHKKPRLQAELHGLVAKPKVHECSICGVEFAIGQALGGHMRRHRGEVKKYENSKSTMLFGFDLTAAAKEVDLDKGLLTFKLGFHNHTVVQG